MVNPTHWDGRRAEELYDVGSLLMHLRHELGDNDFKKALTLLKLTQEEYEALSKEILADGIKREKHSLTPKHLGWTKSGAIRTFEWINRFRGDLWMLVAEILDLARLINASPTDLLRAGEDNARFDKMNIADWSAVLESDATSLGKYPRWNVELFSKHILGQSS